MILYNETNYVNGKSQFLSADGNPVQNGSVMVLFSGSEVSHFSLDSAGFGTPSIESGKTYSFEVLDSSGNVVNTLFPVMLGDFGGGGEGGDVATEKAERIAADNALSSRIDSKMDRGSLDNELNTLRNKDAELQNSINGSKYQLDAETARAQEAETALGERIDTLDDIYETKVDAKSKAETYGILMRENGTNTLQFYRPSLA